MLFQWRTRAGYLYSQEQTVTLVLTVSFFRRCSVFYLMHNECFQSFLSVGEFSYLLTLSCCYRSGLDLIKGVVRNNVEAGVIEPSMSKVKIIQVSSSWAVPFSCSVVFAEWPNWIGAVFVWKSGINHGQCLLFIFCHCSFLHRFNWPFCTNRWLVCHNAWDFRWALIHCMRFLAAAYITTISSHIHTIQLGQLDCSTVLKSGLLGLLQFATEAAITILRIDDMIKLFKEENQGGEDWASHGFIMLV